MHLAVLITVFLGLAYSQPVSEIINNSQEHQKFFLYTDENGNIQVEHLVDVPIDLNATAADVAYYYFSQSNPANGVEIHSNNIDAIKNSAYSSRKDTIFIIHGWKNSMESDVNSHIREYILRDHDINVFVVDWSPVAEKNYVSAKNSVQKVGQYVGDFARELSNRFGLQLNKLKFVGHSLGAHVSGCAGAALGSEVDRIVGLDPAGPLFSDSDISNRIDPTDANFVQIIHTNDGMLGYKGILGHADYYPNGGQKQGGCGVDLTGSCSHSRVYELYAESLQTNQFIAQNCPSYDDYTKKTCHGGFSSMGMFNVDTKARGTYYLDTNNKSPYAQG